MSRIALDGKTAVVIGGTSGIGRTMAVGLAAAGANVVATGRRAELIDAVATEIEAQGVRTLRQPTDVEDRAAVQALHDAVAAGIGPVDILVNCAGRTIKSPTIDVTERSGPPSSTRTSRHAARLPGVRPAHARARLRADHQHRVAWPRFVSLYRGGGLRREQGRRWPR